MSKEVVKLKGRMKKRRYLHVKVKDSEIHGRGLFANASIAAGQLIGTYEGPRTDEDGTYVLWIECEEEGTYGVDGQNLLRYTNHSKRPNASFEGEQLYALKNIYSGDEITFHYGKAWE